MKKTIGTRERKAKSAAADMARLQTAHAKFYIRDNNIALASAYRRDAASWVFKGHPELREQ